jgi:hypothetical protein
MSKIFFKSNTIFRINNISNLFKRKKPIQLNYKPKGNDEEFFIFNKIIKNEKNPNLSTQETNKNNSNQHTKTNLDNGFIMDTSQSKSSKDNIKSVNSLKSNCEKMTKKIEKMKIMNDKINNNNNNNEKNNQTNKNEIKFSCCFGKD